MLIRRRRQPRPRFSWQQLAFEVFAVVLGVTLALGANELRQHFADARRVEAATASMAAEMEQNCRRLERSLAYHRRLKAEVDSLEAAGVGASGGEAVDAMRVLSSWKGYDPAIVTSSAYETARATGALELMPYDRALGLGNYYTFIAFYQETVRDVLGAVMVSGAPTFDQVTVALGVTLDLESGLAPASCYGAEQLNAEAETEPTETPPDSAAATS